MKFPNDTQRLAIIGRTGSGKTQAGAWHLANRSIDEMRWVILDYKQDALLNQIPGLQEIDLSKLPHRKGLYIAHPLPNQEEQVEEFLWRIWSKENTGLYVDEGYMLGRSKAFSALLTQGRSKHIPVIVCTQRPVWLTKFVWSESDFFQVFRMNTGDDYKKIHDFIPHRLDRNPVPDFHSYYYDVGKSRLSLLTPAPDQQTILDLFAEKIGHRVTFV